MIVISIIIPVYNTEQYLPKCIESILHQKFKDFELILIDDDSTDKSGNICDYYKTIDKRIIVIHKRNEGASCARNTGLSQAKGKYITFIDSDDYVDEKWLEGLYDSMENSQADLIYANYDRVDENGKIIGSSKYENTFISISQPKERVQYILDTLKSDIGWEIWNRLFKREIIQSNDLQFCETCSDFAEDMGFVLSYVLYCRSIGSTDSRGYKHLIRNNSLMGESKSLFRFDSLNEVSKALYLQFMKSDCNYLEKQTFPLIHFAVMYNQYKKLLIEKQSKELKKELEKIKDQPYYVSQTKRIFKVYSQLKKQVGKKNAQRILLFSTYCLFRNHRLYSYMSMIYYKWFWK